MPFSFLETRNAELPPMTDITSGIERWIAANARLNSANPEWGNSRRAGTASQAAPGLAAIPAGISWAAGAPASGSRGGGQGRNSGEKATQVHLGYEPFEKQQHFHASPAKYRLFGGAAGPGKTKALLMEAIMQAHEMPGAHTLLLRRTFPELEQSLLLYFRRDISRELYSSFNESKHLVTWRNGSTTRFGYCQNEQDVYQYQGAEFLFIGIDELTLFTLRQWQFLTSRNRCPIAGSFPCMAGATNPGNIGHAWVKSLWIDKQAAAGMEQSSQYDPADYDFIPARVSDNPIYANDAEYLKTLRALPTHLRRAFLDGDWDVFAGQYFDRFDAERQVARAETIDFKPWWSRWVSVDWGFEHPAAVYWHTSAPISVGRNAVDGKATGGPAQPAPAAVLRNEESPTKKDEKPRRVVTYREYVTRRTPPRELAREIIARSRLSSDVNRSNMASNGDRSIGETSDREKIDAIYLSPDAFARRTDEASIAEQMGDIFAAAGLPRPIPADDDRVGGWMLMYQMLEGGEWLLTENCIELIRTLPNLVRDAAKIEDIEKMDGDDTADAARYGLKSRYGASRSGQTRAPYEQRVAERIVSEDPTIRAIQAKKALIEESKGTGPLSFFRRRRR
jgi:phage terminase large subunit